ncbi:MAG: hypothetical protein M0Z41_13725 [Peptococcaceae bacterium]|nr:hypothetical protein [Peptococcaceae bacterium]
MRSERGSAILEYLLILGAAAMIYFGGPLLIHGVQDWLALANAERVAMHQVAVTGQYGACAQQRLDDALQAANIPPHLVQAQGTTTQQQYGQPVSLALQYTYSPASWIHIPLSAGSQTISQYLPGQVAGGGCPPGSAGTVATGAGVPSTVTIYANPNPAAVGQAVTFSGEVLDQYGNPVPTNVTVSGGGQSAQVYAQGGYYSAVLAFAAPGSVTVWASAGSASVSIQLPVNSQCTLAANFTGPSLPSGWWFSGTPAINSWNPLLWDADYSINDNSYNGRLNSPYTIMPDTPLSITITTAIPGNTNGNDIFNTWHVYDSTTNNWLLLGTYYGQATQGWWLGSFDNYPYSPGSWPTLTTDGAMHRYTITLTPGSTTVSFTVDNGTPVQVQGAPGALPPEPGDMITLSAVGLVQHPSDGAVNFQVQSVQCQ